MKIKYLLYFFLLVLLPGLSMFTMSSCKKKEPEPPPDKQDPMNPVFDKDTMMPFTWTKLNQTDFFSTPIKIVASPDGRFFGLNSFQGQLKQMHPENFGWNMAFTPGVIKTPDLNFGKDGTGLLIIRESNLWTSQDNGTTWLPQNHNGIDLEIAWEKFDISGGHDGDIFVFGETHWDNTDIVALYYSNDGASNFTQKTLPADMLVDITQESSFRDIKIGSNDELYLITPTVIYLSVDDGDTWTTPYPTTSISEAYSDMYIRDNGEIYLTKGGSLYLGDVASTSLSLIRNAARAVYGELPNGNLLAGIERSEDGGVTWLPMGKLPEPTNGGAVNKDGKIVVAYSGKTYVLPYGETSWQFSGLPKGDCVDFMDIDGKQIWMSEHNLFVSRDYGATWRHTFYSETERFVDIVWMGSNKTFGISTSLNGLYQFDPELSGPVDFNIVGGKMQALYWLDDYTRFLMGIGDDPNTGPPDGELYYQDHWNGWKDAHLRDYICDIQREGDMLFVFKGDDIVRDYLPDQSIKFENIGAPVGYYEHYPDIKIISVSYNPNNRIRLYLKDSNVLFAERLREGNSSNTELFAVDYLYQNSDLGTCNRIRVKHDGRLYLMTENGLFLSNEKVEWM